MAVTFTCTLNGLGGGTTYTSLSADLAQAAADWSGYLNSNADIRVQVDVGGFPDNLGFIVQNDSNDFATLSTTADGKALVEPWGERVLQTGSQTAGSPYDIHIYLNLNSNPGGATVYINPDPAAGGPVPSGEYDATTMFRKALGYGLGFAAMTTTDAQAAASRVTPLDQYIRYTGAPTGTSLGADDIGAYDLFGSTVEAVYGGPVPLVTPQPGYNEAFVHMGNTPTVSGASDIMAVTQDIVGKSLGISALDLAIMQEAGVPIVPGILPCFAKGTLIATPRGAAAIESLRVGDTVLTAARTEKRIRWFGWRHVDCHRHPRPEDVWPVRIEAGAFGDGRPSRALFLSPDPAVFGDGNAAAGAPGGRLPVGDLVNGASVAQHPTDRITYWHLELDHHTVILADDLACETYLDTGNRAAFANGGPTVLMNPDFAFRVWDTQACAPLVLGGPRLVAARRFLLGRAVALGHVMTDAPDLRVYADDREVAVQTIGRHARIVLPDATETVRLVSRVWVPAEMRAAEHDTRSLGVAIARLWLDRREVSLESPGLGAGWHAPEPDGRWTNGDAWLTVTGIRELAFHVAMRGTYWHRGAFDTSRSARIVIEAGRSRP